MKAGYFGFCEILPNQELTFTNENPVDKIPVDKKVVDETLSFFIKIIKILNKKNST